MHMLTSTEFITGKDPLAYELHKCAKLNHHDNIKTDSHVRGQPPSLIIDDDSLKHMYLCFQSPLTNFYLTQGKHFPLKQHPTYKRKCLWNNRQGGHSRHSIIACGQFLNPTFIQRYLEDPGCVLYYYPHWTTGQNP